MPLIRFPTVKGLVYTIDLSKITDRENPRVVEAAIRDSIQEPTVIDWGDGSPLETVSTGAFHEHTYAAGAGDVFTVVIRSATGHLPRCKFSADSNQNINPPTKNLTHAVTSIDHFAGWCGLAAGSAGNYMLMRTANLQYADPRYVCGAFWTSMSEACPYSGFRMSGDVFSFEFQSSTDFGYAFSNCRGLTGKTPKLHDGVTRLAYTFQSCIELTELGDLPSSITNWAYAFHNCYQMVGQFPDISSATGGMANTFYSCTKLAGPIPDIPSGVTSLKSAFYNCRSATAFPENIANTITDVSNTFESCFGLNIVENSAPELWNSANYPSITASTQCFKGLTNLSNYADIPSGWK